MEENKEEVKVEEQKKNNKYNDKEVIIKRRNRKIILISTISIILVLGIIFSTIFAIVNMNNDNIVSGVKIEGIDVSGISKSQAKAQFELLYNEKKQKDILLKYKDYETTINPEVIETEYNIEKAVEEAVSIGKNSNIFINNYNILFALFGKNNIEIELKINEEEIKKSIEDIQSNIPNSIVEPNYYIEDDKLIITKGKEGLSIDTNKLIEKVKENLCNLNATNNYIEIPVVEKKPENIDIDKIYENVHKEVKDAYYTKDPFTIYPEVEGIDFDIEEAKKILQEDKEEYEIELTITKPEVTTAQIGSEAFPELLSTFSTRYDAGLVDRSTNLRIACEKINDKVVLPGEIFSYNQTLGERTVAAGYKNAKIYSNGQVVDGVGGGICQISTTLYNAILMANMEATERRNHQFITSYVEAGRDATVVYGMTDFKFKNTRTYAIKIKASASNGIATVSIYGIKEENEYKVSFETNTISTIPCTIKYIDDNTLPAGQEKVSQGGANGVTTETYIIKSLNGRVVSRTLLSKDTYNPLEKIILRGTKGTTKNTTPTTSVETSTIPVKEEVTTPNESSNEDTTKQETTNTKPDEDTNKQEAVAEDSNQSTSEETKEEKSTDVKE